MDLYVMLQRRSTIQSIRKTEREGKERKGRVTSEEVEKWETRMTRRSLESKPITSRRSGKQLTITVGDTQVIEVSQRLTG